MVVRFGWKKELVCVIVLVHGATATAETIRNGDPETTDDQKIVVLGQSVTSLGNTILGAESIQEQLSFSSRDMFRSVPDVTIGGGGRNAQRIYLNGIEGSNLNISVDGARSGRNLHQHRGGFGGVDPDLLQRVEIDSTTGVADGPGGLGGSIRMTTMNAREMLQRYGHGDSFGARLKTGYSSVDEGKHGDVSLYGMASEHFGVLAHVAADNRGDYETGSGRSAIGSGGQDRDYLLKVSMLDFNDQDLHLGLSRSQNAGLYARGSNGSDMGYLPENPTGPSSRVQQKTEEDRLTLEHRWNSDHQALDLRTNLYRTENRLSYPGSSISDIFTREWGMAIRNDSHYALAGFPSRLTVGADWFEETAHTNALDMQDAMGWPDLRGQKVEYTSKNLGVFVENQIELGSLTTTVGLRLDDFSSNYGPIQVSGNDISPAFRFDYRFDNDFSAFASYSKAARASGVIPVGFLGRLNHTTQARGGNLDPEKSRQHELGVRYTPERLPLTVQLKTFQTRIDDTIQTVGRGSAPLGRGDIFNGDRLEVSGWQLSAQWDAGRYSSQLGLNILDVEYGGKDPGAVRRLTAPTGDTLVWDNRWQATDTLSFGYRLELVADLKDVPQGEPQRDGYHIHSVRAHWSPVQDLELALAIDNMFDRRYANHTSLFSQSTGVLDEPGRDVRLSLAYNF